MFSCFARPDSSSAIPRASGPFFRFYAPKLIFGGTGVIFGGSKVVESRFNVLRARFVSGGTEGVMSRFQELCFRTHFQQYRGRLVPISCFVLSDSFSAVPSASGLVFMFCAPGIVFGGTGGVWS
jgi:hypothetical protein